MKPNQTMQADGKTCHSNCCAISAPGLPAVDGGVGMTPHVKLNVQMPADCSARVFFFFN